MATKIRVELENAISEGIGQVKKDIKRLDDPTAIDKLVGRSKNWKPGSPL